MAFVHNFPTHYTARLFELLSAQWDVDFYFSSEGDAWYWPKEHGITLGSFQYRIPRALRIGRFRLAPSLARDLWVGGYDVYIKSFDSRIETLLAFLIARLRRRPFVLWTGVWSRIETLFHRLTFPFLKIMYRSAAAVVVYGDHVRRYLVAEGVDERRIFVAPHSVDNHDYRRRVGQDSRSRLIQQLGLPPGSKVVLFVGRLAEEKGVNHLLEAAASLDREDVFLVILGSGSERTRLERRAAQLGIGTNVRFVGYVRTDETLPYYAIARMTVLPSIATKAGKENWGLVVNESFNQGVPVIATQSVGAAAGGLVEDGITGRIVPERSSAALANAIVTLLDDDVLIRQLGVSARERVAAWTQENMADAFEQAVESVLSRSGADRGA